MDLNSIKFETADIALLFKNSLVEIEPKSQAANPEMNPESEWKFLGDNKKNTLVIVRYTDLIHLPDKQLSFLTKLLAACNLSLGDVAVLNFQNYRSADYNRIMDHFKPKVVLLFDTKPGEFGMPMNFPEFQVQAYTNTLFVSSPSLELIEPDKTLKGKLWVCLKKIFNL